MSNDFYKFLPTLRGCKYVGIATYPNGEKRRFYADNKQDLTRTMYMFLRERCTVSIRAYKATT